MEKPVQRKVTVAEKIALVAVAQRKAQVHQEMVNLLKSMGLDSTKSWNVTPDDLIVEVK